MNEQASTPAEHRDTLPLPIVPRTVFAAAMLQLTGYRPTDGRDGKRDGRRAAMLAAIEYRATWGALRSWLRGNRNVPQWALDLLLAKLATRQAEAAYMREHVRLAVKPGPGRVAHLIG